jgi:uncharacterized protein
MKVLGELFGESPFGQLVEHANMIKKCIDLIKPIAEAIIAGRADQLRDLQDEMSRTEFEADKIKDHIRARLPNRFFLPVQREDVLNYMSQLDRMGDDAEDFAVVATFRRIVIPPGLQGAFLALVNKAVEVSNELLNLAVDLGQLQKESFEGPDAMAVLEKIKRVSHMEWESDKLSRAFARQYYSAEDLDTISVILLEKLCRALTGVADHAENVGKYLGLMIARR